MGPVFLYSPAGAAARWDAAKEGKQCPLCDSIQPTHMYEDILRLRELADKSTQDKVGYVPELVVVTANTYPKAKGKEVSYRHWTVKPEKITTNEDKIARCESLKGYLRGLMDTRLAKLTKYPEAYDSVQIMVEEQKNLERPDHYSSCLRWVQQVQRFAKEACGDRGEEYSTASTCFFEDLSCNDRARLRLYAILQGRSEGQVHLDFQQSSNVVDFLSAGSREDLRREMDSRSDPRYYMVSALNRKLNDAKVTSKHLIALVWDGKFKDDLDIHVTTPNGVEIYYGNRQADGCKLDFDANVNHGEAEPCENVSVKPGQFIVHVNNYTRRTNGQPVPFEILCRQQGKEDVVYPGVWETTRQPGNKIEVCRHTFTEVGEIEIEMSEKAAARAKALNNEWTEKIGDVTAAVATLGEVTDMLESTKTAQVGDDDEASPVRRGRVVVLDTTQQKRAVAKNDPEKSATSKPSAPDSSATGVSGSFMDLANKAATKGNKKTESSAKTESTNKRFLSERCRDQPQSLKDLMVYLEEHPATSLKIHARDYAPGYLTMIKTSGSASFRDIRKASLGPAACHFHDKNSVPVKPVRHTVGNARFDKTWFANGEAMDNRAVAGSEGLLAVTALVDDHSFDGCTFFALQGVTLPKNASSQEAAFPLAGGFYPAELHADFHAHRERWAFCNTQVLPSMPPPTEVAMVGAFVTAESAVVYLDGARMTLRNP
jgi:hypothetical protein